MRCYYKDCFFNILFVNVLRKCGNKNKRNIKKKKKKIDSKSIGTGTTPCPAPRGIESKLKCLLLLAPVPVPASTPRSAFTVREMGPQRPFPPGTPTSVP